MRINMQGGVGYRHGAWSIRCKPTAARVCMPAGGDSTVSIRTISAIEAAVHEHRPSAHRVEWP